MTYVKLQKNIVLNWISDYLDVNEQTNKKLTTVLEWIWSHKSTEVQPNAILLIMMFLIIITSLYTRSLGCKEIN